MQFGNGSYVTMQTRWSDVNGQLDYICREFNNKHPERLWLHRIQVHLLDEKNVYSTGLSVNRTQRTLWEHYCIYLRWCFLVTEVTRLRQRSKSTCRCWTECYVCRQKSRLRQTQGKGAKIANHSIGSEDNEIDLQEHPGDNIYQDQPKTDADGNIIGINLCSQLCGKSSTH